jgi:molybdopterin synthase catalytic subunit
MHPIRLTPEPIDASLVQSLLSDPRHGAQLLFHGVVRNSNQGRQVQAVSYDAYRPLAEACFQEICREASVRFGETLQVALIHRVGRLEVGEISVSIAVGLPHRDEAYQASRYIIEELKKRAPIWKKEHYVDGESEWLQGHALCSHG